ncbi:GIY-YIG nuclease family protein [Bradyrhizobium yuanmingense]|uniref:GIY-YIG nuclease family protein n=1 Tax=Bradyrhizobium yuanmingense TaxID=108015 RepID=UPI0004BBC2CC|nr:GIY-YIG nuclease family protein [Bradyrhizobium yuanmingense]
MATKYGPYKFPGVVDCGQLIDMISRDMAVAKAASREHVVRFLDLVKQGHADWLSSHNLRGRALRRAGSPFSEAYDHLEKWLAENAPPKKPRSPSGFVYFIGQVENPDVVKIGFATDVAERLATLQTGSPFTLTLVASFPGTMKAEKLLHRQFASDCIRGEWFKFSSAIHALLKEKQDKTGT